MPLPGFRRALVVGLVLLALGVGLASTHATASAQAPPGGTITTQLQPGWNMIGWLGPDTSAGELFDAIPALNFIVAWDGGAQRHRWVWRASVGLQALPWIQQGRGLALHIGGEAAVEWTRPAAEGVVLLSLRAGNNLAAWGGLDGTPIEEALDWLGDAVVGASRWNAATRESERYRPGARSSANTLRTLNRGDALWVQLTEDASWWQSGTAGTEFVFEEAVNPAMRAAIRTETARVLAFFVERYGFEPPAFAVRVDPGLDIAGRAGREKIELGSHGVDTPRREFLLAHEYFHILQHHLGNRAPSADGSPAWLTEGTARYVQDLYSRERRGGTGDAARTHWWRRSLEVSAPLSALEAPEALKAVGFATYDLGALAVDWLVRRAAAAAGNAPFAPHAPGGLELRSEWAAHLDYYRLRQSSVSWRAAFEAAFGIAVDDFYAEFGEYRAELTAGRLPHLADDVDAPILVFEGEIPPDTAARIRAEFESVQVFFRERLGGGPADYTVFVVADWPAAVSVHLRVSGVVGDPNCGSLGVHLSVHVLSCDPSVVTDIAWQHFIVVRDRLAPTASLPPAPEGYWPRGASWLQTGIARYVEAATLAAVSSETLSRSRNRNIAAARHALALLRNMEASAGFDVVGSRAANGLAFLAANWLVQRAGEPALFEYYRLLPSLDSWEAAFEGAFGIGVAEFYDAFEAYRAEVAPPLPHLADDLDEPILVLVGEVFPRTAVRFRTEFRNLQAFFRDRFGGGPADYTLYVAADRESAAAIHRALGGTGAVPCGSRGRDSILLVLTCDSSFPVHLATYHSVAVMAKVGAPGTTPAESRGLRPSEPLMAPGWHSEICGLRLPGSDGAYEPRPSPGRANRRRSRGSRAAQHHRIRCRLERIGTPRRRA